MTSAKCPSCEWSFSHDSVSPDGTIECPSCGHLFASDSGTFYLWQNENRTGPFTVNQMKSMWNLGQLNVNSPYWREGMSEWSTLADLQYIIDEIPIQPQYRKPNAPSDDWRLQNTSHLQETDKRILVAFLLWLFLGFFGAHRFYAGKIGSGFLFILLLITSLLIIPAIILIIWLLIDLILILTGRFKDSENRHITKWT